MILQWVGSFCISQDPYLVLGIECVMFYIYGIGAVLMEMVMT